MAKKAKTKVKKLKSKKSVVKEEALPLHRKYRPKKLDDIVGNEATVSSLKAIINKPKGKQTTFLFTGPSGCGKTTLARIVARELGCTDNDVRELNISKTRGIAEARKIIDSSSFAALSGKGKCFILNECHGATKDFWESMLETLEEPPRNTYFILCTTEPEKIKVTVRNRCTTYTVEALLKKDLKKLLEKVLKLEKVEHIESDTIKQIVSLSSGSPRQALVFLDQVIELTDKKEIEKTIQEITTSQTEVIDLCFALHQGQSWDTISKLLNSINAEPESVRYAVLGYFASQMLKKPNNRYIEIIELFAESFMYSGKAGLVSSCYLTTQL